MAATTKYTLLPLSEERHWKLFHQVPQLIYYGDPNWICPLESDVRNIFRQETNKTLEEGAYQIWILLDERERPVGRIAAFIDHARNRLLPYPVGAMGFFECINDRGAAHQLLQVAEEWVQQYDIKAIDGPINFGERDKFYGLLVRGWVPPLHQENYHPPYYRALIESYGYRPFEQILTLSGQIDEVPIERFRKIATRAKERYPLSIKHYDPARMEDFAKDFLVVYNKAFRHFEHFKELELYQVKELFEAAKPIIDPNTALITYYNEEPVGISGMLPDINPFLRHAKGKLNLWTLPRFLLGFKLSRSHILKGVAWGIAPANQKHGVYAVMVDALYQPSLKRKYKKFCLATIRGHNKVMIKTCLNLGVHIERIHYHYRKMLDQGTVFEPMEFWPED